MSFTELPIEKAFMLIEPGPVLLVTTHEKGRSNIMTISWHMALDFSAQVALMTGPWNHSFSAMMSTRECVINVPAVDLAETTVRIGDCSGTDVDKFKKFGLTELPGKKVKAPLIQECLACLECRVSDYLEQQGIFILQGVQAWIDPQKKERRTFHAHGDGTFSVDGETLNFRNLMEDKIPSGV